jgi:hypothetical protein
MYEGKIKQKRGRGKKKKENVNKKGGRLVLHLPRSRQEKYNVQRPI